MNDAPIGLPGERQVIWTSKDGTHRCEHASTPEHYQADLEAVDHPAAPQMKDIPSYQHNSWYWIPFGRPCQLYRLTDGTATHCLVVVDDDYIRVLSRSPAINLSEPFANHLCELLHQLINPRIWDIQGIAWPTARNTALLFNGELVPVTNATPGDILRGHADYSALSATQRTALLASRAMRITFDIPSDEQDILTAPPDLPESISATLILPAGRAYQFPKLFAVGGLVIETDGNFHAESLTYAHHIEFKGSPQIFGTHHTRVDHITAQDVASLYMINLASVRTITARAKTHITLPNLRNAIHLSLDAPRIEIEALVECSSIDLKTETLVFLPNLVKAFGPLTFPAAKRIYLPRLTSPNELHAPNAKTLICPGTRTIDNDAHLSRAHVEPDISHHQLKLRPDRPLSYEQTTPRPQPTDPLDSLIRYAWKSPDGVYTLERNLGNITNIKHIRPDHRIFDGDIPDRDYANHYLRTHRIFHLCKEGIPVFEIEIDRVHCARVFPNDKPITTDNQHIGPLCTSLRGLISTEGVRATAGLAPLKPNTALMESGELLPILQAKPEMIVKANANAADHTPDQLLPYLSSPLVLIEFEGAGPEHTINMQAHVDATFAIRSGYIHPFYHLRTLGGLFVGQDAEFSVGALEHLGYLVYDGQPKSVSFPSLKSLNYVQTKCRLNSLMLDVPRLHDAICEADVISFPNLTHIDKYGGFSTAHLDLPLLVEAHELCIENATTVALPSLQKVYRLEVPDAEVLIVPRLTDVGPIYAPNLRTVVAGRTHKFPINKHFKVHTIAA